MAGRPKRSLAIVFEMALVGPCQHLETSGEELVGLLGEDSRPHEHPRHQVPVAGNIFLMCYRSGNSSSCLLTFLKNTLFRTTP